MSEWTPFGKRQRVMSQTWSERAPLVDKGTTTKTICSCGIGESPRYQGAEEVRICPYCGRMALFVG